MFIPDKSEVLCSCAKMFAYTDAEGAFDFGPVMNGNHRLVITNPDDSDASAQFYPARPGNAIQIALD
jgi:hypothetical protein